MLSIWNKCLFLLLTTVIACRCARLPIEASLPIRARLPIEARLSVEARSPTEERLPQIADDTPADTPDDTPILLEETTTTPAPTATELGTTSTTAEIQTNKPANVCTYEQKTYAVNEQFSPDQCTSCSCKEGNITECAVMSCMECISGPPIYIEGQCCPVCETTTTTEYTTMPTPAIITTCEENGKIYVDGEQYKRDVCTTCWCERGQPVCAMMSCLQCEGERVYVAGQCCPVCHTTQYTPSWVEEPCNYNGMVYYPGDFFMPDPCTSCTCKKGGNPVCKIMQCEYCNGAEVPVPDQCCPQCIPVSTPGTPVDICCQYDGEIYHLGEEFSPDPCTFCRCDESGEAVCAIRDCAQCHGVAIPVPGQCCPDCIPDTTPAEPVETCCEYLGEVYKFGEEFSPDPCTFCKCEAGGEPVCAVMDCAECWGETVHVEGQCCPVCKPFPLEIAEMLKAEPECDSK